MKILKRPREGVLHLLWTTLWPSGWGRTPRWSVMLPTKGSIHTSWRWTGDLESLWVSWKSVWKYQLHQRDPIFLLALEVPPQQREFTSNVQCCSQLEMIPDQVLLHPPCWLRYETVLALKVNTLIITLASFSNLTWKMFFVLKCSYLLKGRLKHLIWVITVTK